MTEQIRDKKAVVRELMELGKSKGQLTNQEILDAIGAVSYTHLTLPTILLV